MRVTVAISSREVVILIGQIRTIMSPMHGSLRREVPGKTDIYIYRNYLPIKFYLNLIYCITNKITKKRIIFFLSAILPNLLVFSNLTSIYFYILFNYKAYTAWWWMLNDK